MEKEGTRIMDEISFDLDVVNAHDPNPMIEGVKQKYDLKRFVRFIERVHFLEDIANFNTVTFFWMSLDWRYLGINGAVARFIKLKSFNDMLNKTNIELFKAYKLPLAIAEKVDTFNKAIINNGEYVLAEEEGVGKMKPLCIKGPLLGSKGALKGLIGLAKWSAE